MGPPTSPSKACQEAALEPPEGPLLTPGERERHTETDTERDRDREKEREKESERKISSRMSSSLWTFLF